MAFTSRCSRKFLWLIASMSPMPSAAVLMKSVSRGVRLDRHRDAAPLGLGQRPLEDLLA
jgi:hypothetical protein